MVGKDLWLGMLVALSDWRSDCLSNSYTTTIRGGGEEAGKSPTIAQQSSFSLSRRQSLLRSPASPNRPALARNGEPRISGTPARDSRLAGFFRTFVGQAVGHEHEAGRSSRHPRPARPALPQPKDQRKLHMPDTLSGSMVTPGATGY